MDADALLRLLRAEPGPRMLVAGLKYYGLPERIDGASNQVILDWARELRLSNEYTTTRTPWCGLFMAWLAHEAEKPIVDGPLWALNWKAFGHPVDVPMLGDVGIKTRNGGGHVTLIVAETRTHWICLGGNQSDTVCFSAIPKDGDFVWAFRRPPYINQPGNVRRIILPAFDATFAREA